ncbi:MAG: TetR/AcrR family transcriptional regulator [Chloroflexi bacterium]|nr:TetR/AcrR family transcriptional regulator [Chloroflexota bacterium]MCZ6866591.1 TetR/AcrR family transcriptional regulator [Chloroflexota bacterium]
MKTRPTARDRIMEAAEVVFAEKGYHDTAMDEIVRRTDMSKGGLYFHFPSKERLFFAVMDHLGNRLAERINASIAQESDAIARLEIALTTVLESLGKRRRLAKLLLVQGYSMGNAFEKKRIETYSRFASLIKDNLDLAVEEGSIPPIDTEIVSHLWVGAVNEVLIRWLYTGKPAPVKEALPVLKKILLRGVGVEAKVSIGG